MKVELFSSRIHNIALQVFVPDKKKKKVPQGFAIVIPRNDNLIDYGQNISAQRLAMFLLL